MGSSCSGRNACSRKRKDDEKKLREKKRKTKIKRKEQKQKPKEEKRPKKKAKVEECGKVNNQEVENAKAKEEAARVLECEVKISKREEPNPPSLLGQEAKKKTSKKKSIRCERALTPQTKKGNDLPESSCHLEKTLPDDPTEGEHAADLLPDTCKHGLVSHLNSLQITIKQDLSQPVQSVEEDEEDDEDWHVWNASYKAKLRKEGCGKREKIYETDEFIHYLLNYYQPPQYDRVYEDPMRAMSKSRWQREVRDIGNGFQINLNQSDHHIMQNGQKVDWAEEDGQQWEPRPREAMNTSPAQEFAKKVKRHCTDPANEAVDLVSDVDGEQCPLQNSHIGPIKDSKHRSKRKGSSQSKLSGSSCEVSDFLEEISSDSDCFNETISEGSEHQSPNSGRLVTVMVREDSDDYNETIAFDQEKKCSYCGMYPKLNPADLAKPLGSKLKKTVKRSRNELKYPGPQSECETNGVEKNTRKKKKKPEEADRHDKDDYPTPDLSSLQSLGKPEKKRSKVMESKMKCKPSCGPVASSQSIDIPPGQELSKDMDNPWKMKSVQQNVGASNRCVKWKDQTPTSSVCVASCDGTHPLASDNGFGKRSVLKLKSF